MTLNKFKQNQKGFTLIELMIVIAIIGILAAVAIPNYIAFKNKSYCTATISDGKAIAGAVADYFSIPSNTSLALANAPYTAAAAGGRPRINIGGAAVNTLLLSASTTGATVTPGAGGTGFSIAVVEGAGNCPQKVVTQDPQLTGAAGAAITYTFTL